MKNLFFLLFLLLLPLHSSFASTLKQLFSENFYTIHKAGYCGQNILNFLKVADEKGIDLRGAEIINVDGGWVSPLYVRNGGYTPKIPGKAGVTFAPSEKLYYFHIFLIHEGHVYDFDYGNTPVVPKIGEYFKKMWLTGKDRDKTLSLKAYDATEYLQGKPMPANAPQISVLKFISQRAR
jgi:hypothetical protein